MAKKATTYQKKKAEPNQPGPGYRTSKNFRKKIFGGKNFSNFGSHKGFNPSMFKTQHKG
jgi:uncharacterized Zn-finger protein